MSKTLPLALFRKSGAKGGRARAVSEGLDRDRAVDESGNQMAVFGRIGGRPMNREEMRRLYLKDGEPWFVDDEEGAARAASEGAGTPPTSGAGR